MTTQEARIQLVYEGGLRALPWGADDFFRFGRRRYPPATISTGPRFRISTKLAILTWEVSYATGGTGSQWAHVGVCWGVLRGNRTPAEHRAASARHGLRPMGWEKDGMSR